MQCLTADKKSQQHALSALCAIACHDHRGRVAISSFPRIIKPLMEQMCADEIGLVHSAALLLGYCCSTSTEFRQRFNESNILGGGVCFLVAVLSAHLHQHSAKDMDNGLICNLAWSIRAILSDAKCRVDSDARQLIGATLPVLFVHSDSRIQMNAVMIAILVQQREGEANVGSAQGHQTPSSRSLTFRRDKSLQAVSALTRLASTPEELPPSNTAEAPLNCQRVGSATCNKRPSLLGPWKRKCSKVTRVRTPVCGAPKYNKVGSPAAS